jgi:hypothetical protein
MLQDVVTPDLVARVCWLIFPQLAAILEQKFPHHCSSNPYTHSVPVISGEAARDEFFIHVEEETANCAHRSRAVENFS